MGVDLDPKHEVAVAAVGDSGEQAGEGEAVGPGAASEHQGVEIVGKGSDEGVVDERVGAGEGEEELESVVGVAGEGGELDEAAGGVVVEVEAEADELGVELVELGHGGAGGEGGEEVGPGWGLRRRRLGEDGGSRHFFGCGLGGRGCGCWGLIEEYDFLLSVQFGSFAINK